MANPKPLKNTKPATEAGSTKPKMQMNLLYNRLLEPNPKKRTQAQRKLARMRKNRKWANIRFAIIAFVVFALIFNYQVIIAQAQYFFNGRNISTQSGVPTPAPINTQQSTSTVSTPAEAETVSAANVIIIPKLNVNAPLQFPDSAVESVVLKSLESGVVHYAGTAKPGEIGNATFFGHSSNDAWVPGNYKYVFVLLEKLVPGDTFEIHYNTKKYVYQVTATKTVAPNDLSVLAQTTTKTASLITCTPPGTSWKRFVVSANQIAPTQTPVQQTEASTAPAPQPVQPTAAILPSNSPSLFDQIASFFVGIWNQLFHS